MRANLFVAPRGNPRLLRASMSREELFAAICILCCVNGSAGRAIDQIERAGWFEAVFQTFGLSAIVLVACIVGVSFILRERGNSICTADLWGRSGDDRSQSDTRGIGKLGGTDCCQYLYSAVRGSSRAVEARGTHSPRNNRTDALEPAPLSGVFQFHSAN